jgi:hypothetical protein
MAAAGLEHPVRLRVRPALRLAEAYAAMDERHAIKVPLGRSRALRDASPFLMSTPGKATWTWAEMTMELTRELLVAVAA